MIPKTHFTLVNTSIGGDPAVVAVNSALRTFKEREVFPWHLRISIACKFLGANGMPTNEENDVLYQLEDSIDIPLHVNNNAIFLARITARSQRVLLYRVRNPETANNALQFLVNAPSQLREWDYHMEHDLHWSLAAPELSLVEKDKRFN